MGLTVRHVSEALKTAIAGSRAGEYRTEGNSYRILVQLKDAEKRSLDEILDMTVTAPGGQEVALRNVVSVAPGRGPMRIDRKDQQRIVRVGANVAGRDLGSVATDVQARLAEIEGVEGIHDLHIWSLTSGVNALSCHVEVRNEMLERCQELLDAIRHIAREEFSISHVTAQIEPEDYKQRQVIHWRLPDTGTDAG